MTVQRVECSAAPRWRDRHMATDRQYHVTDPAGRQFVFCSACCLLSYAVYGITIDVAANAQNSVGTVGSEAAA
jgi:hypothetical protein